MPAVERGIAMGLRFAALLVASIITAPAPALAQTDDIISNDAIQLLATESAVSAIGAMCVETTGNDPAMLAAMDGWKQRNRAWQITAVSTLGARSAAYSPDALSAQRDKMQNDMVAAYDLAADKPAWCLRMANDLSSGELTVAAIAPDAARRVEEARAGKWPVLDLTGNIAVWTAYRVKAHFREIEVMLEKCAETFGDPRRLYADAWPYWRNRNLEAMRRADVVINGWGALAPNRLAEAHEDGETSVDILFFEEEEAEAQCKAFIAGLEAGKQDIATTQPDLLESLQYYAEKLPGPDGAP
jgi:hypothetical protein